MLYPVHLLVNEAEAGWRVETLAQRAWRPTVLVPRGVCLFESLACAEIRLHELPGFARLQARRLSPFAHPGASAVRRGGRLLLWLWDADEVERALTQADLGKQRLTPMAEPLYLAPPPAEGEYIERSTQCNARGLCEGSALLSSMVVAPAPLDLGVLRPGAWAHDWLAGWGARAERATARLELPAVLNGCGGLAAAAAFAFMAYQGGELLGSQHAASRLESQLEQSLAERGQASAVNQALQADAQWVLGYEQAVRQLDFGAFFEALRPTLERHGVVLREFEAGAGEVRFMAVAVGGEIRLPELLADLGRVQGARQVRLMQQDELKQATFSMQVDGFFVSPWPVAEGDGHGRP